MNVSEQPTDPSSHEIEFGTLIISIATSALIHLGEHSSEENALIDKSSISVNIPLAKQSIDMLGILQEKTRGNLTAEEHRLLEGVLYDLRLKYVKAVEASAPK